MNKKLVAVALVLLIAASTLFAAIDFSKIDPVTATLEASIGDFFNHGFIVDNSGAFISSITVEDAFAATPPPINYGYSTNKGGAIVTFTITDFENVDDSSVVKIKKIEATNIGANMTWNSTDEDYTLFEVASVDGYTKNSTTLSVYPARTGDVNSEDHTGAATIAAANTVEGGSPGFYRATMTFSVTAST